MGHLQDYDSNTKMAKKMKNLKKLGWMLAGILIWYLFLSLCNWSFNLAQWSVFSRFILGIFSMAVIYAQLYEI